MTAITPISEHVQQIWDEFAAGDASTAWLLCDRHPDEAIAITFVDERLTARDLSFGTLRELSNRAASVLRDLGVEPGDRVATLMGKSPELVATMLGAWRLGAVYVPLFTAFGPQAIAMRLADTATKVVVVDVDQRPKLDPGEDMPADGGWQIVVNGAADGGRDPSLATLLQTAGVGEFAHAGGGDWPLVHMHTSGTTGKPKGVVHPLTYVAGWATYLEFALGVRDDDVYWCAADPGWAYGLYCAIAAPLARGVRSHLACGGFAAGRTLRLLATQHITNLAAAPTVYRALRNCEDATTQEIRLRCASSAGEPLTPEVNEWAEAALGTIVRDHYGQTELGMVISNVHHADLCRPIKTGSMGQALPGWSVAILSDSSDEVVAAGTLGRLAVDVTGSPLMTFRGYAGEGSDGGKFTEDGRWYLTGDAARQDADGDIFFSARDDDVIIMAGYRIGPFDIESVLVQHDGVAECAVIAVPDEVRGEVIEAIVVPAATHEPSDELARELQVLVKERYAAHTYPRAIHFRTSLPKTPSGKVQRAVLREERLAALRDAQQNG